MPRQYPGAIRWLILLQIFRSTACIASQNLRWSSRLAPILVNRPAAVVAHQSAKASLEHGDQAASAASAR